MAVAAVGLCNRVLGKIWAFSVRDAKGVAVDKSGEGIPSEAKSSRLVSYAFLIVFASACGMYMGQLMGNNLFSKFVSTFGLPASVIGLVTSSYAITAILMRFISGPAMDAFSRKKLLMFGMALMGVSFLGYSLASSVEVVIACRLLQGCSMAFASACCLTLASDVAPKSKLGSSMGIYSMAEAACSAIGPTVGLWIANTFGGFQATYAVAAVILFCAIGIVTFVKEPPREKRPFCINVHSMIAVECLPVMCIMFFLQMAYYNQTAWLVIYAGEVNTNLVVTIGLYFTVFSGIAFFTRPMYGALTDRFGTLRVLVPSMAFLAISFWIISFSTELWHFLLAAVFAGFGYAPGKTVCQILIIKFAGGQSRRGVAVSSAYISQDFGKLVGPTVAGFIITALGYRMMWRVMSLSVLVAFCIVLFFRGKIAGADAKFSYNDTKKAK